MARQQLLVVLLRAMYRRLVEASRLPRAYFILVVVALLQVGLIVLVAHTHVVPAAAAVQALLLWRLARGGRVAWTLLLAENLLTSLVALAIVGDGSGVLWGNMAVAVIPGLTIVSLLLSTPIRRHVGLVRTLPTQAPLT